ncbi:MAG: 4-hydroxy-tetrahydrodipicolinate reductase [Alphaproteobacteria bacterium]|nr:4-hydroxy-tetrahydrodipicolinate reductase [Alphaproteobacteria bacterium]MCA0448626.1 4-hydroxy-tetrahydrodipicolinate reductase [Pseudomonadota bacterium]
MRIGIVGAAGRMGQMLIREVQGNATAKLGGAVERAGSDAIGRDAGELAGLGPIQVKVGADPAALFDACDAVIDFTAPAASIVHAGLAAAKGKALILGTTGITAADQAKIDAAAKSAIIVQSTNFSPAVVLSFALVEEAARRLGPDYDIEIFEMHHRHKVDAPSGTALSLGRAAAKGRGIDFDKETIRGRDGHTGARPTGPIGFSVARGGSETGEHNVMFLAEGERLEIVHKASNRQIYARGAVRAALWAKGQKPGLYSMRDVLGL